MGADVTGVQKFKEAPVRAPTISRSVVRFEYSTDEDHARLVQLLRKAIIHGDLSSVLELKSMVKDIRGV